MNSDRQVVVDQKGGYQAALKAHATGQLTINWGLRDIRPWAKQKGWSVPLVGFKAAFTKKMFESESNFRDAVKGSGIEVYVPSLGYDPEKQEFIVE